MPVKKGPDGERSVEAEVEVPGTPEEVWEAIATGPGMSAWFVPSTSEERVGGTATNNFGPGMESVATIEEWDPPHRFIAGTDEDPGHIASEWTVEARDGGSCVVRVVHRWFADSDEWDHQFEGHTYGWQAFFRILRQYLEHFRGRPSSAFQLSSVQDASLAATWRAATASLGAGPDVTKVDTPSGPAIIERLTGGAHPELLLRLQGDIPGLAHLFAMSISGQTMIPVRVFLYGGAASDAVKDSKRAWEEWLDAALTW